MPQDNPPDPVAPQGPEAIARYLRGLGYNVTVAQVRRWQNNGVTIAQMVVRLEERQGDDDTQEDVVIIGDGDGTGGSGGGGSGGGMSAEDRARMNRARRASFISLLHSWKMNPRDVEGLISRGVNGEWSTNEFVNALRQTKAYKQQFVGIGATNLSESAYNTKFFDYRDRAKDIGRGLTRQQFGTLLKRGVDAAEWNFRVEAAGNIKRNRAMFNWYERELRRRGLMKGNKQLSYKEMWGIVTKQKSEQFERVYETAFLQTNLAKSGFDLRGKDRDISRKDLLRLIRQYETGGPRQEIENFGTTDFAQLADEVENLIPLSALHGAGVTKRDLLEMRLGGPRAQEIAEKVGYLKATFNLGQQPDAQPQIQQEGRKKTRLVVGGLSGEAGY